MVGWASRRRALFLAVGSCGLPHEIAASELSGSPHSGPALQQEYPGEGGRSCITFDELAWGASWCIFSH